MRRIVALIAALALLLAMAPASALAAPSTEHWIVSLRSGSAAQDAADLARQHGGRADRIYRHALDGFLFRGSANAAAALSRHPSVALVEADAAVQLQGTQSNPTWGLDRIDERTLPLDGAYVYDTTGAGVTAYVIDSGIRFSHAEFGGRASSGFDAIDGGTADDCHSHGTHVAGTIGGASYGVAKAVSLVAVRVFDCSGGSAWSTIIAGIDWVAADHQAGNPAVANLSLGGPASSSVDTAVRNLLADGVSVSIAAGNGDWLGRQVDACTQSPARVTEAMTISATDSSDRKASWANYGSCVDWFAPGVGVSSAGIGSDTEVTSKSGTSMAAPHTAGVAALYLQANPGASPHQVRDTLFAATTRGVVTSSSTTNNHLLYNLNAANDGAAPPPEPAPMHVGALSGTATKQSGSRWKATVTITVHTSAEAPLSGATVTGSWSAGASGSSTCTTGSTGTCTVTKSRLQGSSVTFTVDSLTASGYAYASSANHPNPARVVIPRP